MTLNNEDIHLSTESLQGYRSMISHVPQNPYLFNGTIAENVAVSSLDSKYNISRIKKVLEMVKLDSLASTESDLISKIISDNGANLSGGQRQRMAIARALYKNSKILVFDEATSSLDLKTEKSILQLIDTLPPDIIVIMIAHRLHTLKSCTHIYKVSNSSIIPCIKSELFHE